ncbi:P-loop containing nucleoside triphosphate hydrolase protein, partial [Cenococcum geophilum 1.58]|uniref:P-loop containing nucleoside triphosphate hydrolase protein n=1 Tax=Cenococcum geophilum 1.58 TaxID=794803 RepID=UPI00358FFB6E
FDPKEGRSRNFSLDRLTWAVQDGLSATDGREYLAYFQRSEVSAVINRQVAGVPSVFYAVETNNEALIRTWVEYGADVNALEPGTGLPLLAFAILNSTQHDGGSMLVLRILLSNGADVTVIPSYLLEPIHPENDASTQARPLKKDASQTWCNGVIEKMVENSLTVSQKYFIRRRSRHPAPSSRFIQVAREYQLTELCGLPFTMIGQDLSIEMLTNRLLTHLITPTTKPLVLTFAGPSGHGKTEVGRRLGDLLSLKMLVVDMTQIKHETDLFGPYSPYVGYEKGSPLNNFLADNSGRKAIVMLDEIEKSGSKIMDANLIVFDEGRYQDRRSRMKVNCTNIIWILATNALDSKINEFSEMKFAKQHNSEAFNPKLKDALVATLFRGMKEEFGAPLSRRVSAIIPFLPFFLEEQMVIAYKYLLELKSRLRQPIAPRSK